MKAQARNSEQHTNNVLTFSFLHYIYFQIDQPKNFLRSIRRTANEIRTALEVYYFRTTFWQQRKIAKIAFGKSELHMKEKLLTITN